MTQAYNADATEVLTKFEPIRRRSGIYTDTTRPNHLGQEAIDNSVDEVLADHVKHMNVILHADQSLEVVDGGRGMSVDTHPEEGAPAVGLILRCLHAGGKFSNKNYQFSGDLYNVGISVANVLSEHVEVNVRRDGRIYNIAFRNDEKAQDLQVVDTCGRRNIGTSVHFWSDETFPDNPHFSVSRLAHVLKTKTVLCSGTEITFKDEISNTGQRWYYQDDPNDYLAEAVNGLPTLSEKPFVSNFVSDTEAMDQVLLWLPGDGELLTESYVNLIPAMQGGTHVNSLRQGLLDMMRKFCEYHNILPRGVRLLAKDIWDCYAYVLSVEMQDPQLAGQTEEHLSSRRCTAFVSGVVKDTFILWLNQNVQVAKLLAETAISNARRRIRAAKRVVREKLTNGPALPSRLADCTAQDLSRTELFLVEGDSAGESARQACDYEYQAIIPLEGKILSTWEVSSDEVLASQRVHDISIAIGINPDNDDLSQFHYNKIYIPVDADSDGLYIATLLCVLFVKHFRALVKHGHVYVVLPLLYRTDLGKEIYYALMEEEKEGVLEQLKRKRGKPNAQRFKGLGEVSPIQLRETTLDSDTRCLVQLIIDDEDDQRTDAMMDMLLAKERSEGRCSWPREEGDTVEIGV